MIGFETAMKPGEVQTYLPPPPHQIVEYLNGHIIGHYVMKKAISVAIYTLCGFYYLRPWPAAWQFIDSVSSLGQPRGNL